MAKKKKKGKCPYCGETRDLTSEHFIPRCLFSVVPADIETTVACGKCNAEKGKHDDYLRDILIADWKVGTNSTVQSLLDGKFARSVERNHSQFARVAKSNAKLEAVHSDGGIYLGHGYSVELDSDRWSSAFSLIVRGLYHKLTRKFLPQACSFDVRRISEVDFNNLWPEIERIGYNGPYTLGEDVFMGIFIYAEEEPAISYWWLWFYNSICISVRTRPSDLESE
ncbi:MAG: hypothetical protein WBD27_03325 [Pyrinomonadaceae bacterium]